MLEAEALETLLKVIGGVTAIASASGVVAYFLFRTFATKWIDSRFAERLEAFRHQQNQEIEHLRFRINTTMDRNVKLHQHEFEALPETWSQLTEAFFTIEPIAIGFRQYPDLNQMSAERLEDFLSKSPLSDVEKSELRAESDKVKFYIKIKSGHEINAAIDAYNKFHAVLTKNSIFIIENLKMKFGDLDGMLKNAIIERQVMPTNFEQGGALHSHGRTLLKSIETEVQQRLWS